MFAVEKERNLGIKESPTRINESIFSWAPGKGSAYWMV